jgi:hypothetical protein
MADAEDEGLYVQSPRIKLMQEVAEQMDAIRAELGDDFAIGHAIIVVQVHEANGGEQTRVRSNAPYLEGLGLLRVAEKILDLKHDEENAD